MTNKLSFTFILTLLLLAVWLFGCGESETIVPAPTGQVLEGTFVLTKAVTHELMDVGGPDLDDPIIIRRVPTTYVYPDGTGRLTLGEGTFELDAPLPVHPLKYRGRFKTVEEMYRRWGDDIPHLYYKQINDDAVTSKLVIDVRYESGDLATGYGKYPYEWIGDTLKLDFWRLWDQVYIYELYWTREAEL